MVRLRWPVQVNPRGWVWRSLSYVDTFVSEMLLQALDIRDLLETDRFMAVHVDTSDEGRGGTGKELAPTGPSISTIETYKVRPAGTLKSTPSGPDVDREKP